MLSSVRAVPQTVCSILAKRQYCSRGITLSVLISASTASASEGVDT